VGNPEGAVRARVDGQVKLFQSWFYDLSAGDLRMYKFCFFVPVSDAEATKDAVFQAGGGRIGDYDCCAWQTLGQGQFRPLDGSNPHLGEHGQLELVDEVKVELVCEDRLIRDVVAAMKRAHPYEEPAYEVYRLENF
jgi:hypothetical protein